MEDSRDAGLATEDVEEKLERNGDTSESATAETNTNNESEGPTMGSLGVARRAFNTNTRYG